MLLLTAVSQSQIVVPDTVEAQKSPIKGWGGGEGHQNSPAGETIMAAHIPICLQDIRPHQNSASLYACSMGSGTFCGDVLHGHQGSFLTQDF